MPAKIQLRNLQDAQRLAENIKQYDQLEKILPSLNDAQQAMLFKALGSNLTPLMTKSKEFQTIHSLAKNPDEFIVHLLTTIEDFRQVHRILLNSYFSQSLFSLELTHPELVEQVKKDVTKAIKSFHDLRYYQTELGHYLGRILIQFLGANILSLGSREELEQKFAYDEFVLNSYDYYKQEQDTRYNRGKYYVLSFFYAYTRPITLMHPGLLDEFYKNKSGFIVNKILESNESTELKIKKLSSAIYSVEDLVKVLSSMTPEIQICLLNGVGNRLFKIIEYNSHYSSVFVL